MASHSCGGEAVVDSHHVDDKHYYTHKIDQGHQPSCMINLKPANSNRCSSQNSCGLYRRSFWNTSCSCIFSAIPDELLLFSVFTFLPLPDLAVLSSVCSRWKFLASDRGLWRHVDLSDYSHAVEDISLTSLARRFGSHLEQLKLCGCKLLTSQSLFSINQMARLRELHLCNLSALTDDGLTAIAATCSKLERVYIPGCVKVSDAGLHHLASQCKELVAISVRGCLKLTDSALIYLGSQLQSLNISECSNITASSCGIVAQRCPNLLRLNLGSLPVTDAAIDMIAKGCPRLQTLVLSTSSPVSPASLITDAGVRAISTLQDLRSLNLQGCSLLTDSSMQILVEAPTFSSDRLLRFNLGGCYRLTDATIMLIVRTMPQLTHLSLAQCFNLSDSSFALIASRMHNLEHLNLHNCVGLSTSVNLLLSPGALPNLANLHLGSCRNVPVQLVRELQLRRPQVSMVYF